MTCDDLPDCQRRTMIEGVGPRRRTDPAGMTSMQGNVVLVTVTESENVRAR